MQRDCFLLIKATALVAVPILFGALFFIARAPGGEPGVYLETRSGMYELSSYSTGRGLSFLDVPMKAPVVLDGIIVSFFIVGSKSDTVAANASSAKLYFFVVDHADARFASEYVSVPVTIRQVNPRAYHVTAEQLGMWGAKSTAFQHYRDVLARTPRSRTTMEVMAGLVMPDSADGSARLYPVRFGPTDLTDAFWRR